METPFPSFEPHGPNDDEARGPRLREIPLRLLVPNVITVLAICAGLSGVRLAFEGRFELAGHAGFHGHCGTFGGRECEAATQKNSPTKPATIRFVNSCCRPAGTP